MSTKPSNEPQSLTEYEEWLQNYLASQAAEENAWFQTYRGLRDIRGLTNVDDVLFAVGCYNEQWVERDAMRAADEERTTVAEENKRDFKAQGTYMRHLQEMYKARMSRTVGIDTGFVKRPRYIERRPKTSGELYAYLTGFVSIEIDELDEFIRGET